MYNLNNITMILTFILHFSGTSFDCPEPVPKADGTTCGDM